MHLPDRRGARAVDWLLIVTLLAQLLLMAYGYGRLDQRVADMYDTVQEIKAQVQTLSGKK